MTSITRFLRGALASLALAGATLAAHAAPTTQLGFLIDASGSIGSSNFTIMKNGYAAALGALPTDGSIEVTVYTFATTTTQVVPPTVVTGASLAGIVNAVSLMNFTASNTATALGINTIAGAMLASSNFAGASRSIINIATDGNPTVGTNADAIAAATAARDRGIDALTAEAIGSSVDTNFLRSLVFSPVTGPCNLCGTLLPDGSTPTNPMTSNPWVLQVNSFNDFPVAINAKVQAIVNQTPEPGALALVGLALALGAGVSRRRRG